MKNLHIVTTNDRRILLVKCSSDIPNLLKENEIVEGERFYQAPKLLKEFLKQNPDQLAYFLKGFAYWVEFKTKGYNEHPGRFGLLKRAIQKFSTDLFQKIRALSGRIAEEIKKIIKPKKALYKEQRTKKKIYRALTSGQIRLNMTGT